MNKLKELEQKYKELGEEIERLKNQGKVWKPKKTENYFLINVNKAISDYTWGDSLFDNHIYELGNCFKTKSEAETMLEKIQIYTQLKRLAEEINTESIDWQNREQEKYYICYKTKLNRIEQFNAGSQQDIGQIYSTNDDFLKYAFCRIGEENLLKLFKE